MPAMSGLGLVLAVAGLCAIPPQSGAGPELVAKVRVTVQLRSPKGPVPGMHVRFLDTAPPPSARGCGEVVGNTDAEGKLDAILSISWPDYFAAGRRPDAGTFDIIIADRVIHAAIECLPESDGVRQLRLGDVEVNPDGRPPLPDNCFQIYL